VTAEGAIGGRLYFILLNEYIQAEEFLLLEGVRAYNTLWSSVPKNLQSVPTYYFAIGTFAIRQRSQLRQNHCGILVENPV
jgi:hypothetical protein